MNKPSVGAHGVAAGRPDLPESLTATAAWWDALGSDPRAVHLTSLDWLDALDTAKVLVAFADDVKHAGEVRIRKDRLERRLRELAEVAALTGVPAADAPAAADEQPPGASRGRYGDLRLA